MTAKKIGNSWYYVFDGPKKPTGERNQQKRGGFKTKRAAELAEARRRAELADGKFTDPTKMTVAEYAVFWVNNRTGLRESTRGNYHARFSSNVIPWLGNVKLTELTAARVQHWQRELVERGYAGTTIHDAHALLTAALDQAVAWGNIPSNPCRATKRVPKSEPPSAAWTADEVRVFLSSIEGDRDEGLYWLALASAMRRSELVALRWQDIDLDAGRIRLEHTASRRVLPNGRFKGWHLQPAKTRAGRRTIWLDEATVAMLRRHRVRQHEERLAAYQWDDAGFVFPREDGTMRSPDGINHRFLKLLERCDVPRLRFHDLRHTCVSLLVEAGVDPVTISERIGHTDVAFSLNRYARANEGMHKEAARRMGVLLSSGG